MSFSKDITKLFLFFFSLRASMVAHAIGDIITGDVVEPEVVVSASPSVGGLLDSLTGSIGISSISSRAKPVAPPVASSNPTSSAVTGTVTSDANKTGSRPLDKDVLRTFISSSMPFGSYFLLWYLSSCFLYYHYHCCQLVNQLAETFF